MQHHLALEVVRFQVPQTVYLDHKSLVLLILYLVLPLQEHQEHQERRPLERKPALAKVHPASRQLDSQVIGDREDIPLRLPPDDGVHPIVSNGVLPLFLSLTILPERQEINYCDEDPNSNNGLTPIGGSMGAEMERTRRMLIAHGVLAALAFVILFPAGAITIRLASFPGVVWFHAAFQAFAYLVYIAAFGLGVYLANEMRLVSGKSSKVTLLVLTYTIAQQLSSHYRHSRLHPSLLPTSRWLPPSLAI